ncbi:hypothetical protein GW17_00047846, partial [Ensete ventricosum]
IHAGEHTVRRGANALVLVHGAQPSPPDVDGREFTQVALQGEVSSKGEAMHLLNVKPPLPHVRLIRS